MPLQKKDYLIYILFVLTLFLSLILGENSSGGSKIDYLYTKKYLDAFNLDFTEGMLLFYDHAEAHFPFFYILIANLERFTNPKFLHIFYILLSSLIPIYFFKCLKIRFPYVKTVLLFYFSLIIFFSPYFRSSAVWITTDNLALFFFILSIYNFLSFEKKNHKDYLKHAYLSAAFLIFASYIRQYYVFFYLFYFFSIHTKLNLHNNLSLIGFNCLLSTPAVVYIYYFYQNTNFNEYNYIGSDFIFNILVFSSLIFFYLSPFLFTQIDKIIETIKFKAIRFNFLVIILFFILLLLFYEIQIVDFGGGIFYKMSKFTNINLFYLFSFFGMILLILSNVHKLNNFIIFLILILCFPLNIIYQKYYDPLIIILFFTIFRSEFFSMFIINLNKTKIILTIFYFFLFLTFSNFYYGLG